MFIVHVIGSLDPGLGGPPQVAAALASVQQRRGHRVAIAHSGRDDRDALIREYEKNPGFTDIASIPADANWPGAIRGLDALTAEQIREADVLHFHGVWEPLLVAAAATARSHGIPYVIRPAGMLDPWSMRQKSFKKAVAMRLVFRRVIRQAAFIHVLTDKEAGDVKLLGTGTPTRLIPNGVHADLLDRPGDGTAFRQSQTKLGDAPYVLFMARLHYKKGLDRLVDGFAELAERQPELHLVIAGPEEGDGDNARAQVEAAGLRARVHFVGPLYGELKQSAMRGATCFALPSRQEGFSVALLEALGAGCPIVISEDCHFEHAQRAGAGIVSDTTPAAYANALATYTSDPDAAREAGRLGKELIRTHYTWDAVAEQLDAAYTEACNHNPKQARSA